MTNPQKKQFKVLAILPRHDKPDEEWFMKVGTAFENRDGSLTVFLNAIPCTSSVKLQIRELDARDLAQRETYRSSSGSGSGGDRNTGSAASRAATSYPTDADSHRGSGSANEALPF